MHFLLSFLLAISSAINVAEKTSVAIGGVIQEETFLGPQKTTGTYCSGFVVYQGRGFEIIATARHCLIPTDNASIKTPPTAFPFPLYVKYFSGYKAPIDKIWVSDAQDLGFVRVRENAYRPTVSFKDYVERGDPLFVFGMPMGFTFSYSDATSMRGTDYSEIGDPWNDTFMINCAGCAGGDSGGPVFNNKGQVVGMLVAGTGSGINVMVPAQILAHNLALVRGGNSVEYDY